MLDVLQNNILPYWEKNMQDHENGGFYGRMTGDEKLMPEAEKGAILNARILWTYSSAYRLLKSSESWEMATRAKRYLIDKFYDKRFGGIYWSLDNKGNPLDTKKQIYALGFAIYGLSEYHRATGDREALDYAIMLFKSIEEHSFDKEKNGYLEALTREWNEIEDMRLSEKDANEKKTMNTHLHILEPYTNLYRVWKNDELRKQIKNLVEVFLDKILNKETNHLRLFFDENWNGKDHIISYGHDIEASWLIHEAALVLEDETLLKRVEAIVPLIANAAGEGLQADGGMIYEKNTETGEVDADRHWWVQAETVVGYINLYEYFNNEDALEKALQCWNFIKKHLIDSKNGEWFWSLKADGTINTIDDKAGFWKCPYHNGRMCMELLGRFQ
ncbi:mannobiose 2-epimerase [Bacteroides luti]|uniref:Cellobiose 2-epimerase n=2 Tax=Bacteroides luti TaxID=1297750 RepID=A0A1M4WNY5_9BACE|nr:mannobiose 2-epimerase [Bacteroides luti]